MNELHVREVLVRRLCVSKLCVRMCVCFARRWWKIDYVKEIRIYKRVVCERAAGVSCVCERVVCERAVCV